MEIAIQNQLFIVFGIALAGFAVIGWILFDLQKKVKKLCGGSSDAPADLSKDLLWRLTRAETKLEEIEPRLVRTETIAQTSIQKVGFLRFNPFNDTGGDNSFILSLLDRDNNGILITSLYLRDGMRLYAKKVETGKTKQQLSEEEAKVLESSINRS